MSKKIALFFATGFFSGYAPFAPGTFGTVVGILIFYLTKNLSPETQISLFLCYFAISYFSTVIAIAHFSNNDPPQVVCDEVMGIWLALIFFDCTLVMVTVFFIVFRLLDILKPFPIRQIEKKFRGAWGVLLDDIAAGLITKGIIWIMIKIQI
jgi:phosphatidylglycerophosphatase A